VKELVENAIDAGAKTVTVELQNGGISFLRVSDDGCGMSREDAKTAFLRHATSKLRSKEDLAAIGTLGFRGEALAATAAVSRVDLLTRCAEDLEGTHLSLEAGKLRSCEAAGMGFIAMKGLAGGLLTNAEACMAFMRQYNALPIWGVQREGELAQWLAFFAREPELTPELAAFIEADRKSLAGEFCRGCGYCMPCTVGITINQCARISQMLRRAPSAAWLNEHWQAEMAKIDDCVDCGLCMSRCPYGLEIPRLLRKNLADYRNILNGVTKL